MLKKTVLVIVLCLLASVNGWAQVPGGDSNTSLVITLKDAVQIAMERNINVILADERVNQAMARIRQARANLYPQLSAGVSESRQTRDLSTVGLSGGGGVVGPFDVFDARLKLTQTIFDLNAIERWKSARASATLSQAERELARQDVLALVAILFIDAKRSNESVEFWETLLKRDEKNLIVAQKQFEIGTGSELTVKEVEATLAKSTALLATAKTEALEGRLDLLSALGFPPEQEVSLQWDNDQERLNEGHETEKNVEIENHPRVVVARETLAVSQTDKAAEKAGYLPKFSLLSDYGLSGDFPQNSSPTYFFGAQVTLPIFEGGEREALVDEVQSRIRADAARLEDIQRQVHADILVNRKLIHQAEVFFKEKQADLSAAEKNLELARLRWKNGIGNEQEFLAALARQALSLDQKEEAAALLLTARINLAHARGEVEKIFVVEKKE